SRRRHTRFSRDWSSDVCSSDLFKRYQKHSFWGIVTAFTVGLVILGIINSGIIPGLPTQAGKFEIFFVNTIGLPYTSGIIIFVVLFLSLLVYGIYYSEKRGKVLLNVSLLSLAFILVGYMSYILVLVRAEF